jgi:ectoine hydroxylase-related dioxygenase (phytanoyl-CoA dioxygenase family)
VASREEAEGYSSWSVKEGVVHVQPPVQVLEQMLSIRLHLDPADDTNGALWVSPASHRLGRLPVGDAASVAERIGKRLCAAQAGDALLFRPLMLHASRKATSRKPRRVIHLEFTGASLPKSLAWAEVAASEGPARDARCRGGARSEQLSTLDRLSTRRGQGPFRGQRVAHLRNVR